MKKNHLVEIYRSDNRYGFESRVYLGTLSYDTDEELDKLLSDVRKAHYDNCHTVYTIKVRY